MGRFIGAGGITIDNIQKLTKTQIQIMGTNDKLAQCLGTIADRINSLITDVSHQRIKPICVDGHDSDKPITYVYLYGEDKQIEKAIDMLQECIEAKAKKLEIRRKQYERKKKNKSRTSQLKYLEHRRDYEVLEIGPNAKKSEIRAAYKKLAKKWHPDKYSGTVSHSEAIKRFLAINQAFESISA